MKKVLFKRGALAFAASVALVFAGCADIAENETESIVEVSESAESADRAAISGISSFYADNLTHGTYTSTFTNGNYTIYATSAKPVATPYAAASRS